MSADPNMSAHKIAWDGRAADAPITPGGSPNPLEPPNDLASEFETTAEPETPPLAPNKTDIAIHKVSITFFQNEYASSLTVNSLTLPELRDLILTTKGKTKSDLPWLKGARFGNKRSPAGSLRSDENVLGFDLIELDYDKEVMSIDEAITTIKAMNVRALIYTTPSHTKAAPRWRILLPMSRGDYAVDARAKICARVHGRFGKVFAAESFTLSQSYYYGLALDNPAPDHRCEVIEGRLIDVCADFLKFQNDGGTAQEKPPATAGASKTKPGKFYDRDFNLEVHLASIGDGDFLEGFNNPLSKAAASYAYHHGAECDRAVLKEKLREAINAAPKKATRKADDITRYLSDKYLDDIIASAVKKYGTARQNGWGDFDWRERKGRWSSSACASCCSISLMQHCYRWWGRNSPLLIRKRRRP
jgi:hypothetical protein